jgi:hypothetical protein
VSKITDFEVKDLRGLEPPEPLIKAMELAVGLQIHQGVAVHTDRCPLHLHDQLRYQKITFSDKEQNDGSWITHIWKN